MVKSPNKSKARRASRASENASANRAYNGYVQDITSIVGHDKVTYNTTLGRIGRVLFGRLFLGVVARDELPASTDKKYLICNLDNRDMPGSHWIAIADNIIYDSFGRDLGFDGYVQTEDDAEQHVREDNCGQRCLAWLCVYHSFGPIAAMQI